MKIVREHINEAKGFLPLKYEPPYKGNINIHKGGATKIPEDLPKKITGGFICSYSSITSLVGAPQSVGGDFYCYNTNITSLEGAPQSVGGDFYCSNTNIISLVGAPKSVGGTFDCSNTNITSLEGAPEYVGGNFYCSDTKVPKEEVKRYWKTGAVRGTIVSDHGDYEPL